MSYVFGMTVYMIAEIVVHDEEMYSEYVNAAYDIVSKYGGQYLVRGGNITPLSGDWKPERVLVIKFDDMIAVQNCFSSVEYRKVAHLRENSTTSRSIIVEGLDHSL